MKSQCDLIAAVLADGQPHTAAEIHERCGFSRLNSRIAELRSRRGLNIECRHVAGVGSAAYEYRLVGLLEHTPVVACPAGVCSSGVGLDAPYVTPPDGGDSAAGAAQLTVFDALGAAA